MLRIELEKGENGALVCRATQRGEELGHVTVQSDGEMVRYCSGALEDPSDYGLLDGLVRAAFDAAGSEGAVRYLVSAEAAGEYLPAFETYDYHVDQPEELEKFFGRHSCKGLSGGF